MRACGITASRSARLKIFFLTLFCVVAIAGCGSQRTADLYGSADTTCSGSVGTFAMSGELAAGAANAAIAARSAAYSSASLSPFLIIVCLAAS
jgi:hypothetical protein